MNKAVFVLCALLLGGCMSRETTMTYYAPTAQSGWSAGETAIPTLKHTWTSGAELRVYFRTLDSNADLLFQLVAPEGVTISSADLKVAIKVAGGTDEMFAAENLRRIDYRLLRNGDYEVVYQDLDRLDGSKGASLHRPDAWRHKKLDSMFEWRVVAKPRSEKEIMLKLPPLSVDGVEFSPEPTSFELVTGRVVKGSPAW